MESTFKDIKRTDFERLTWGTWNLVRGRQSVEIVVDAGLYTGYLKNLTGRELVDVEYIDSRGPQRKVRTFQLGGQKWSEVKRFIQNIEQHVG